MTTIYIIDDMPGRHRQCNCLLKALQTDYPGEYQPWSSIGSETDINCPTNTSNATASISADNIFTNLANAPVDSVFLVDFYLKKPDPRDFPQERTFLLEKLESSEYNRLVNELLDQIPDSIKGPYFHAAFTIAFAKARDIPTIVISTHEDGGGLQGDIAQLVNKWNLGHSPSASVNAWKDWKGEILKLRRHVDPVIRGILRAYFEPISNNPNYWIHGLNSFDEGQLGKRIWGLEEIDDTTNKTLHCHGVDWTPLEKNQGGITWEFLQKAVSALKFNCSVEHVGLESKRFYLPIKPGIMFLLSLRELLVAMTSDHGQTKTRPWPKAIKFGRTNKLMFLSIELATTESSEATIHKRFLGKSWKDYKIHNGTIINPIPDGGLSESIFHLGHARLGGINGNEPWSILFHDGSKEWVAWPSFQNDSITFHWHI